MAYRLGIDLGEPLTLAAFLADREVRLLPLVDGAAALPTVAHVKALGGITVGLEARAAAQDEPSGFIEQPLRYLARSSQVELNGQRITGEVLAARLLEAVLATAVARFGGRPDRTVISHPATWSGNSTSNLMAAATRSGLTNLSLIPVDEARIIATTIAGENSGIATDFLGAYGAAVLASKALDDGLELTQPVPMPLVTIEDLDGVSPDLTKREPVIDSIYEPEGPSTVFTEDDEVVPPPAPAPAQTAPQPVVASAPARPSPPPPPASRTGWYSAIGIVAVAVVAAAAYLLFFVDDGDEVVAEPPSSSLAVTSSTSTEPLVTTTTTASTTTVTPTTTTAPSTTSPPSTTTPPTTTVVPELARPGLLALSGSGLVLEPGRGTESNLTFGFDADAALERLTAVVGDPDVDSGWIADEFCSAPEVRVVTIGDLEVIFAGDAADGSGRRTFEQWFVAGDELGRPAGLVTRSGAGIGVSLGDMEAVFGDRFDAKEGTSAGGEAFYQLEDGGPMSGATTGLEPDDTIINMSAGLTCALGGE